MKIRFRETFNMGDVTYEKGQEYDLDDERRACTLVRSGVAEALEPMPDDPEVMRERAEKRIADIRAAAAPQEPAPKGRRAAKAEDVAI